MKVLEKQFSEIASHHDLRCGLGLVLFQQVVNQFKNHKYPHEKLGEILTLEYGKGLTEEERTGEGYPVVGSNGIVGYHDEYLIESPCIVVGRKGSAGEVTYIEQNCYPIDTTFYVKPKSNEYELKFLYYILKVLQLQRLSLFKGVPGLNRYDAYQAAIPLVPRKVQEKILSQIAPIEKEIEKLEKNITDSIDTYNLVFAKYLGFDFPAFNELKLKRIFTSTNNSIRMTFAFNNPASEYLKNYLQTSPHFTNLKNVLTKKIQRGKQPLYTEEGTLVVKTKNIQNGKLDLTEPEFVSDSFYEDNKEKAGIEKDDLLLTSTGMGRGKFALYDQDELALADSHVSIIRFDTSSLIPDFLNYFCQSSIGTGQLRYLESQIKGTPEIYEEQLNLFRVPLISIRQQEKITEEIRKQIALQDEKKKEIASKYEKIANIVQSLA